MKFKQKSQIFLCVQIVAVLSIFASCMAQEKLHWNDISDVIDVSEISSSDYSIFINWLNSSGVSPEKYIIDKCNKHQIVILGENHENKTSLDLLLKIIPYAYHEAGIKYIILECLGVGQNLKLKQLVTSQEYDRKLALEIARTGPWANWGYKEYWDILEAVWQVNKNLQKNKEPMLVIGMDVDIDWPLNWLWSNKKIEDPILIDKAEREFILMAKRDELMARAVEQYVINRNKKGIILVGAHHSFTHYAQPRIDKHGHLLSEYPRMAYQLYQKHGEKVFQIQLHRKYVSAKLIYESFNGDEPRLIKFIEEIMKRREDKPIGFDVFSSPFANLRDENSYYFHFQPNVKFQDICRGYVFLAPIDKMPSCLWLENYISEEMLEKYRVYYESTYQRKFSNTKEINDFISASLKK
jgi:hypothetical protein